MSICLQKLRELCELFSANSGFENFQKPLLRLWAKKHGLDNRKAQRGPKLVRLPMGPLIGTNKAS